MFSNKKLKKSEWTGERLETQIINETTIEHLHRYAIALSICKNKSVLDIASGEGYGSNLLAAYAKDVIGVDISSEVIDSSNKKYKRGNLNFKHGSATQIPLADKSIDVIVSFETLEHHDKHDEMFSEIKRVLKKDGILIMSSPDKKYYTDVPGFKNPFHIKELYFSEFKALVQLNFKKANFFLQKIVTGSLIVSVDIKNEFKFIKGNYDKIEEGEELEGVYNICIASDTDLPNIPYSVFDGSFVERHAVEDAIRRERGSWKYRIGKFILYPITILQRKNRG